MTHWSAALEKINACPDALEWARTQPSAAEAWRRCRRGDWLLWIAARTCKPGSTEHKAVVYAACQCARLALKHVAKGEERPRIAIETAERWARGEATIEEVRAAVAHAAAAAYATAAYATATAAYAAADYAAADYAATAYAADYAAAAAAYAADACAAAADADADADADAVAARAKTLARCATIVRRHVKRPEL